MKTVREVRAKRAERKRRASGAPGTDDPIMLRILKLLDEGQITRKELLKKAGISPSVFSRWAAGTSSTYMMHMDDLARALGVTTTYLLHGSEEEAREGEQWTITPAEYQIVLKMRRLPEQSSQALIRLMDAMLADLHTASC